MPASFCSGMFREILYLPFCLNILWSGSLDLYILRTKHRRKLIIIKCSRFSISQCPERFSQPWRIARHCACTMKDHSVKCKLLCGIFSIAFGKSFLQYGQRYGKAIFHPSVIFITPICIFWAVSQPLKYISEEFRHLCIKGV